MARSALIVGAGIGGLSAGIALRRAGWDVRIFERSASPRELGFGLALAPNALAALAELGIADIVLARGFEPTRGEFRRIDGTVLKRFDAPRRFLGGPLVMALRPALHGALLEAVGMDAITPGAEATGFTVSGDRVTLHLASGTSVDGDLLIGADGVRSNIRRQLHPSDPPPRPSGIVSVRGAAVDGVLHYLGDLNAVYYLGPGVESVFVRASATGIYWFFAFAEELVAEELVRLKDATKAVDAATALSTARALVAHVAPRFDATFRGITSATTDLRYDGVLVDSDPLPFWGTDMVTLLGDAAHPMLPHTGQGAAQAIVDAVALGKALTGTSDLARTLRAYERERLPKTAALVRQGRRTARFMRIRNPVASRLREAVVRMMPLTTFVKLYVRINRRAGTDAGSL